MKKLLAVLLALSCMLIGAAAVAETLGMNEKHIAVHKRGASLRA